MAIGTPLSLGSGATASAASLAIASTANAVTAGDLVIVMHYSNVTTGTIATITDTAGNVYTRVATSNPNAVLYEVYVCPNALAMASTSSISCTFNAGSNRHGLAAMTLSGMMPNIGVYDPRATTTTGTATSANSITLNAIGSTNMFVLGLIVSGATLGTVTMGGSFTAIGGTAATAIVLPSYQIISSPAAISFVPSWVNSATYRTATMAFKGLAAANTSRQAQAALTGVGC